MLFRSKRKIGGDMRELARIGQWLPRMGPTGGAQTGGKIFSNYRNIAELASSVGIPAAAAFGFNPSFGATVSGLAAADLGRRALQSALIRNNTLNRAALNNPLTTRALFNGAQNVLTHGGGAYLGGAGGQGQ